MELRARAEVFVAGSEAHKRDHTTRSESQGDSPEVWGTTTDCETQ